MMIVPVLQYQIDFAAWADKRVLAAAEVLSVEELDQDFKTSEKTVRATLAHIYRAERVWLSRIEPPVTPFRVPGDDEMASLAANWPQLSRQWMDWSRSLTEEKAMAELAYRDLKNNLWTQPLWQIVLHVVNHSTHHRGQVSGFLRALGHTPPNVDSISFAREQR